MLRKNAAMKTDMVCHMLPEFGLNHEKFFCKFYIESQTL